MEAVLDNIRVLICLILFIGATIFIHELGHYLAARALGLVVEVFSIGFGPAIWKKKIKGIVYKISWIPFGGYVALPQIDPTGMSRIQTGQGEGESTVLPAIPPWKKIIVSLAGAAGNVVLAIFIAWFVYWKGMPATPAERSAAVGFVQKDCEAHEKGLRIKDEIVSVNGRAVKNWQDVSLNVSLSPDVDLVAVSPDGTRKTLKIQTAKREMGGRDIPGVDGRSLCMVAKIESESPAAAAGVEPLDIIVGFGGEEVVSRAHLISLVRQSKDKEADITLKRRTLDKGVELIKAKLTPRYDEATKMTRIGIVFADRARDYDLIIRPTPMEQLEFHATAIFRVLGALMTPRQAGTAQESIGGPVSVVLSYWYIVKISVMVAIWFTGFLNVNLAIINLLPIPVLDGGHIVFSLWEAVTRRPVNERVANALVNVSMVMLLSLFLLLTVRDLKWWTPLGQKWKDFMDKGSVTNTAPETVTNALPGAVTNAVVPKTPGADPE